VDKAEQIGLNWWKFDPHLTAQAPVPKALPAPPPTRPRNVPRRTRAARPRR
jgi:hypothetical protein